MELVIITGMSGAGKSKAIDTLEDLGWYCVDNLPPKLIGQFAQLCAQNSDALLRVAVVIDIRGKDMGDNLEECLAQLECLDIAYRIVFLDCADEAIITRYKQTRRRHPLLDQGCADMGEALLAERSFLDLVRRRASVLIDTTMLSSTQLRDKLTHIFNRKESGMLCFCMSFGFKHGLPPEADLVLDLRSLPNPFYQEDLRCQTGLQAPVRDYVMSFGQSQQMMESISRLVELYVRLAAEEGRSQITLAFGCTGGKHRSVVFAEAITQLLTTQQYSVVCTHRDIGRE